MIFKNTFKPTIRHLLRDKSYLLVNVLSLAIGLICCLFIFSYVWNELSYDRFHDDADRIYRLELEVLSEDGVNTRYAFYGGSLGDWLDQVPEIKRETRFATFNWDMNVDVKGEQFAENGIIAADSSFFDLFSFRLLQGTPLTALANPNSIVISKTTALKYFDTTDVLGETLLISFQRWEALLTITGVVEDIPSNSHFSFDMVTSADAYKQLNGYRIRDYPRAYSYILISENATTSDVEKKVNELYRKHAANDASTSRFFAKPMTNIHLHSSAIGELSANSNANYVYLFTVIAFVILGIACVNFTTLATARSVKRARETGMRKVFGAANRNLMAVFLLEGVLLSFAGLFIAYVVAWFLLPYSNLLAGKSLSFASLAEPFFLLIITGLTFLTGVVAGLYPALVLSRHKPASLLGKEAIKGSRSTRLWKSMVVTQFAISMVLIGATYVIQQQMHFIFTKDLGFQKEQIITLNNNFGDQKEPFIEQLNQHSNISQTTTSSYIPGASNIRDTLNCCLLPR